MYFYMSINHTITKKTQKNKQKKLLQTQILLTKQQINSFFWRPFY